MHSNRNHTLFDPYEITVSKKGATKINNVILHNHPGSDEEFECTVADFGTSEAKVDGSTSFTRTTPGVEIELVGWDIDELLEYRIGDLVSFDPQSLYAIPVLLTSGLPRLGFPPPLAGTWVREGPCR